MTRHAPSRRAALALLLLAACSFDGAGLQERQCTFNDECTPPDLCIYGVCQPSAASPDDAAPQDASQDTSHDAPHDVTSSEDAPHDASQDTSQDDVHDVSMMDVSPADAADVSQDACTPALERCDREDNDCDGRVDEDLNDGLVPGTPCTSGVGACAQEGLVECGGDGLARCSATPSLPAEEVCDGADNDCDGQTDEAPSGGGRLTRPCAYPDAYADRLGVGVCAAGAERCQAGAWSACIGQLLPTPEVCDGLDNDCDGQADEPPCSASGCADGARDGFTNEGNFPDIAGCSGTWPGTPPLRAGTAGASDACGDDTGVSCAAPADLCATSWTICALDGDLQPLRAALGGDNACGSGQAGAGKWVAAASHCDPNPAGCAYGASGAFTCGGGGRCTEPICCGQGCVAPGCDDGLFENRTLIHESNRVGCGALPAAQVSGVLCCR